jgi:L-lactate dehydrogenase
MDVCISMPVVLGRKGIIRQIPVKLSESEQKEVKESAKSMREIIKDVEKEQEKDK